MRARRSEQGTTALEVVGLTPLVVLVMFLLLQGAVLLYAIPTAQTAVRQAARAYSQDGSGGAPAASAVLDDSIPGWMSVATEDYSFALPRRGVRATFEIPDVVPFYNVKITREAVMP